MNIYTAKDRTPFVYLIGWSTHNKYYYGVRYAKGCLPSDLWTTYFTSSNSKKSVFGHSVKSFREEYGDPDIIQIRKVFRSAQESIRWEKRFLKRVNAKYNPKFLNKCNGFGGFHTTAGLATAKIKATNKCIGLVSVHDERWNTGEIVGVSNGNHSLKPSHFPELVSKRMKGIPKSRQSIEKRNITIKQVQENGLTVAQNGARRAVETRIKNGTNNNGDKTNTTKRNNIVGGLNSFQRAANKAIKTKSIIGQDGLTISQRASKKRLANITNETLRQHSKKAAETMKVIQEDGKTIRQKASEKAIKTLEQKSLRFDVMHISGKIIYENVTLKFVRKLSPSLRYKLTPATAIGIASGKGSSIVERFISQGKSHLIGLYVRERYSGG